MALPDVIKRLLSPSVPLQPIIALLSDFGMTDHYVGTMKAVIFSIDPTARVIDISHEVRPHKVREGAFLLWASYKFFPSGTVFAAIVDPGVGTARRIIAVRTAKYLFLAPDNGLLDLVLAEEQPEAAIEVRTDGSPYVLSPISSTFHGRDVIAPVAAYLARGIDMAEMGRPVALDGSRISFFAPGQKGKAAIVHIDQFGNIVTSIRTERSHSVRSVKLGTKTIGRWVKSFDEAPAKRPCLIGGSSGLVEIVMKNENAAKYLRATMETPIEVRLQ